MPKPITCIVIDDNELDRLAVVQEIEKFPELKLVGTFDNCLSAIDFFNVNKPAVLFVDIDMPKIDGLDLIRSINGSESINIVISSHPEYALESFQLKVFDFILKPVEHTRFNDAIQRIKDFLQLREKASAYDILFEQENVIFKDGMHTIRLNIGEILYLEAFGDYTKIVTPSRNYLTLTTLTNFLNLLPAMRFVRIHRSFAVYKEKVKEVSQKEITIADKVLPIGKTFSKTTRQAFAT